MIGASARIRIDGGGLRHIDVPQRLHQGDRSSPSGSLFGRIPAYGFFIRHAKNITLSNIFFRFDKEEHRPAILCNDVEQLEIKDLKAEGTMQTPEMIRLSDTRDVVISESRSSSPIPVFLSVYGDITKDIVLRNNLFKNVKEKVISGKNSTLVELGSIR